MIRKIVTLFVFASVWLLNGYAQKDTEFWFVAPAVTKDHCSGECAGAAPVSFVFTTFDLPATVTIEQPANDTSINPTGFAPIVVTIPSNSTQRVELWSDNFQSIPAELQMRKNVENRPSPGHEDEAMNKGIHITATNYITAYYAVEEQNNTDIFALKGRNALGTEFYAAFQTNKYNHYFNVPAQEQAYSAIDIVAVDPGTTTIWVYPTQPIEGFGSAPFSIDLEYGETISLIPAGYNDPINPNPALYPARRLTGTKIVTTGGKRIAITLKDDSVHGDSGCYDLIGDQHVPVEAVAPGDSARSPIIGAEYIIMRGDLAGADRTPGNPADLDLDRAYILAIRDGTNVTITNINTMTSTNISLDEGDQYTYALGLNEDIVHIKSDDENKPIYVLHVTGAGHGCEIAGAILPTISRCTGSFQVGFHKGEDYGVKDFYLNILARDGALDKFRLDNDSTAIDPSNFVKIPSTPWWAGQFPMNSLPKNTSYILTNTQDIFHLGIMLGDNAGGGNYGYFSNYAEIEAESFVEGTGDPGAKICYGETIQLVASGGRSYEWIPSTYLSDPYTDKPFCTAYKTTKYQVIVKGAPGSCVQPDTAEVIVNVADSLSARFEVNPSQGCAPLEVNVTDDSYGAKKWTWQWGDGSTPSFVQNPPPHTYENNTDTAVTYQLRMAARNDYCLKVWTRYIQVFPKVQAGFTQDTTAGCHPLTIQFTDTSSGHLDKNQYLWDFDDFSQSADTCPSHMFTNLGTTDSIFNVKLVVSSPFFCKDSAEVQITAHPYIKAGFSVDSALSCSPLDIKIHNNSIGVQTFNWHFWDTKSQFDSLVSNGSYANIPFYHNDVSQPDPDTIFISMNAVNTQGCTDTATTRRLIVYPEVHALFDLSDTIMCDSTKILFDNNSVGYDLKYDWDFGNGNSSSADSVTQRYFNRSNADTTYYITLAVESDYYCNDTLIQSVLVHPYIKANFALEYGSNCTPLDAKITNSSIRVHNYDWDLGDGTTETLSDPFFYHQYWNPLADKDTTFIVKLVATNNEGCGDSLQRTLLLYPQVIAAFNLEDSVGCSPLDVTFHNNSRGNNLNFDWDFGDNIFSTDTVSTFNKIYNNHTDTDTTYTVTLTALNPYGCDSVLTSEVTTFAEIDADFSLPVTDSCSPFTIRPENYSSPGAQTFAWDFGPLGTSTDFEPVLMPFENSLSTDEDTVYVQLIAYGINDAAHLACADTHNVRVVIFPELDVDFDLTDTADCRPMKINFTNNSNIQSGSLFRWTLDGNIFSTKNTPNELILENLTYSDSSHIIKLAGQSNHGCRDTVQKNVTVYSFVQASFTIDKPSICSGDSFSIDRTTSEGTITNYSWDLDGVISTTNDSTFEYSFNNPAGPSSLNKIITLTVSTSHCDSTWIDSILVHPEVTAEFKVDTNATCYPHTSVFTNQSVNASKYQWRFGDGASSGLENPTHLLQNFNNINDRVYNVKLISKSEHDCGDSIIKQITIYAKPEAEFDVPVAADCPPFNAQFNNASEGMSLTHFWNFNNEATSIDENPTFTFSNEGSSVESKNIILIVTSSRGCKDTVIENLNVYPNVIVDFTFTPATGCSPLDVDFTGDTTNVSSITWYVDEVAWSNAINPSERFDNLTSSNKIFNIRLHGESEYECLADTTKQITVYPSPTVEFLTNPIRQDYNTELDQTTIQFTNQTNFQNNWDYSWDYGDGNSDSQTGQSFNYIYGDRVWGDINDDNKLYVNLLAWNRNNPECSDSLTKIIYINPPVPEVEILDIVEACEPYVVDFSSVTDYIYNDSYNWDFGVPGATSDEANPTYTYSEPGWYTVTLEVEGDGGGNYDYKIVKVNPKPIVDFSFNDSLVFVQSQNKSADTINFYNHTLFGTEYEWDFGDNDYSYDKNPSHYYSDTGTYYVTLISTSAKGCMDTLVSLQPIRVLGQASIQFPTGFIVDPNGAVDGYINNPESTDLRIFRPYAQGVEEYRLEVYNRWGVLVFESKDVNEGWNGYIDGKIAKQDVYVWRAIGRFTNGQPFEMSGDVTLITAPLGGQVSE